MSKCSNLTAETMRNGDDECMNVVRYGVEAITMDDWSKWNELCK